MSRFTRSVRRAAPIIAIGVGVSMLFQSGASALPDPVGLGTATSFGVLAGAGITNTGATTITGDTGAFPTTTETGFSGPAPDFVTFLGGGVDHAGDAVTQGAKSDLLVAYDDAAGRLPEISHAVELGTDTLTPGVYVNGTFGLTGTLTLDFQNDLTASFIFKTASTLITAVGSSVVFINADPDAACRVTWKVGSSATFDAGTQFQGDVLAHDSITANNGATFAGRLLARDGAVTLDTNTIDRGSCAAVAPTPTTTTTTTTVATTTTRRGGGGGGNGNGGSDGSSTTTSVTSTTSTTSATATTATTALVVPTVEARPPTIPRQNLPIPVTGVTGQDQPVPPPLSATPSVPQLPRTGSATLPMTLIGVGLMIVGAGALEVERRVGRSAPVR